MKGSSECRDTKHMNAGLNEVNNVEVGEGNRRLVLSMDIENMYPSLDKETIKKEISIEIKTSSIEISNINWKALFLFLLHKTDKKTIKKAGLSRWMPIKKAGTKEFHIDSYEWPDITPNLIQIRRLLALLVIELIGFIMLNHTFSVGEDVFLQLSGAAIGLDFSRVVSRIIMIVFDVRFRENINFRTPEDKMLMDLRDMDDKNVIIDVRKNDDTKVESDEKTAILLKTVADSIFEIFSVKVDHPSNHDSGKMQILDLPVWTDELTNKVRHKFYMKPTAFKGIIRTDSGLTQSTINSVLYQEGFQRLSNCSPELGLDDKVIFLDQFNLFMQQAGHTERFRSRLTEKIVTNYKEAL